MKKLITKEKIEPILFETYLATIKNSIGSKMFRQIYAKVNGKKKDITKNGELSCAYYTSSLLSIFKLIKDVHATVSGTIKDLEEFGWVEVNKPKIGAILVWEKKDFGKGGMHSHIGFFVGEAKAVSNGTNSRLIEEHHYTYKNTREIEKILWYKKFTPQS